MRKTLWYIKKNGVVTGPFPSQVIRHHLALNRLHQHDHISQDRLHWQAIQAVEELQADDTDSPETKLLLDERTGYDRRQQQLHQASQTPRDADRRSPESDELIRRRRLHAQLMSRFRQPARPLFWPLMLLGFGLTLLTLNAIISPTLLPVSQIDCTAQAGPAINWNNCQKPYQNLQGLDLHHAQLRSTNISRSNLTFTHFSSADMAYADLSYSQLNHSNLQHSNLVGADLTYADLNGADLSYADLSYANLSHANLADAILDNVTLDHAIWVNGTLCGVSSIGQCIPVTSP